MSVAAPVATTGSAAPPRHPESSVKDTVESILVAFILAFIFRAFVVEAFVIPTGSMAPTLLGAHTRYVCNDCGYDFTVNFSNNSPDLSIPSTRQPVPGPVICPNCGFPVIAPEKVASVDVHYGDRILVLKYRYLLSEPHRWDVVVFKAPEPVDRAPRYTTNYIKRLIGRPGESVMMLDGDIYVSTAKPPADLHDPEQLDTFLKTFQIQRKPNPAQEALWRVVFDDDYVPHLSTAAASRTAWKQPWTPVEGSGWNVGQDLPGEQAGRVRAFNFDAASGVGRLRFDRSANPDTDVFTDALAYDQIADAYQGRKPSSRNMVKDLKLSCFYTRQSGEGAFEMLLGKEDQRFTARIMPGKAQIRWTSDEGREVKVYEATLPELSQSGIPIRLDFANVDYRVALRVNGKEVLSTGDDYAPKGDQILAIQQEEEKRRRQGSPNPPIVELAAGDQRCKLEHVSLWRDIFYVNNENPGREKLAGYDPVVLNASPRNIMVLGPDEFFVMGDNPWISSDARAWRQPIELPGEDLFVDAGRVPRRFLLGKAFFVYWPAGHAAPVLGISLIPNFGEMRFIH